jgi:hypothetical protein
MIKTLRRVVGFGPPKIACKSLIDAEYRKFKAELVFLLVTDDEQWKRVFDALNDEGVAIDNSIKSRSQVADALVRTMRAIVDETIDDPDIQCEEFLKVWKKFDLSDPLEPKKLNARFSQMWKQNMVEFIRLVGEERKRAGPSFRDTLAMVHDDLNARCPMVVQGTTRYRSYTQSCEEAIGRALRNLLPYATTTSRGMFKQKFQEMTQSSALGELIPENE